MVDYGLNCSGGVEYKTGLLKHVCCDFSSVLKLFPGILAWSRSRYAF